MGWATITHPFHPLRGQCLEVLKTRRVTGIDTLILRHPELGSYTVAREWTDWRIPDDSTLVDTPARKLNAGLLVQLASLLVQLHKQFQEDLDE